MPSPHCAVLRINKCWSHRIAVWPNSCTANLRDGGKSVRVGPLVSFIRQTGSNSLVTAWQLIFECSALRKESLKLRTDCDASGFSDAPAEETDRGSLDRRRNIDKEGAGNGVPRPRTNFHNAKEIVV